MEQIFTPISWETLYSVVQVCNKCELCKTRTNVVFGEGLGTSGIVFIGEGPGATEDATGRPFVGRAGDILTEAIGSVLGLTRDDVYICNIVKCRPPNNRQPQDIEMSTCIPYLFRQLQLLNPKVIITLGNTPKKALTGLDTGITKIRGQWLEWQGTPLMPTFHPAYLLRNPTQTQLFYEDLMAVYKRLGL